MVGTVEDSNVVSCDISWEVEGKDARVWETLSRRTLEAHKCS